MIKQVLVGLDGSENSKASAQLAISLARASGGTAIGVVVLDVPGVERSIGPVPLGGAYYAKQSEQNKLIREEARIQQYLDEFIKDCEANHINYDVSLRKGEPSAELLEESKTADALLIGLKSNFLFEGKSGDTLTQLLRGQVGTVLAMPKQMPDLERVVIAYDGSSASAKALRAYARIADGLPQAAEVILININDDADKGNRLLGKAQRYLLSYGISARTQLIANNPNPRTFELLRETRPSLLVMGVRGNNRMREMIFGTTTTKVIEIGTVPLLI